LLSPSELEMIAKQLGGTIAVLLKPVLADTKRLADRVEELEAQLKALPTPKDGRDGTSVTIEDVKPLIDELAKSIPAPEKGEKGDSVTVEELRPVVLEIAKELVAELPTPKDGRDGTSVDVEQVRSMVEEVAKSLPAPKDGKDGTSVTVEDLRPVVVEVAKELVAELPTPKDGRDGTSVTIEDVKPLIDELAKSIPAPEKGEKGDSVTLEDLRPVVLEIAKELVAELPTPKDGRDGASVTIEDVKPLIDELAKSIPAPEKGEKGDSVTLEDLRPVVLEIAKELVAELPTPKDGRDALDINILPGIDFTKSYLRDTYATHNGGLWRAHATTEGGRGWECVVDGVKSVEVEQIDERTVDIIVSLASGKLTKKTMVTPTAVYRGVFDVKSEKPYTRGDMATWAGSVWHCQVAATKAKPGENNQDWKLAVKAGRDANNTVVRKL